MSQFNAYHNPKVSFFEGSYAHRLSKLLKYHVPPPLPPGLPAGVVNMVFGVGPRAGEALVTHPDVPLISFTGSTVVGQRIQALSAPYIKRLSLEVGQWRLDLHVYTETNFSLKRHNSPNLCSDTYLSQNSTTSCINCVLYC